MEQKIRAAQKDGRLAAAGAEDLVQAALAAGTITAEEHAILQRATQLRNQAIRVDDFPQDFGLSEALPPAHNTAARAAA